MPTILEEAAQLVGGDRQEAYGPPEECFGRIADAWSAYLGIPVAARDVCNLMILLKVMRDANTYKRDNLVDAAGYAHLADLCRPTVGPFEEP